MKFFTFFSVFLLSSYAVFAVITPAKNCLLDQFDVQTCTNAPAPVPATVRQSVPCAKNDMKCWCLKAAKYTNDVRRRRGMTKFLKVGPVKQLDNAARYARVLGDKGLLEHQQLSQATKEVGCGRWIGGENIAYNYASGDVAKACVNQWENSSGHLENILTDWFEEVVVGFHFESDGRVYCVQTFAQKTGSGSGPGCQAVGSNGSKPKPAPKKPAPTKPAPTKPAPTKPAPTKPAPTSPTSTRRPRKPRMSKKMRNQGNRSCRCIQLGSRCWASLRRLSGNRCKASTGAMRQPIACKRKCCSYCKYYPNAPPCRSRRVKFVCKNM